MLLRHLPTLVLLVFAGGVLIFMVVERARHQANLNKIPTKVLVNGSRGKSSVTRLIRAALSADPGERVVGKTTGSAARLVYPDGHEVPIVRKNAIVNVIEQIWVISRAVIVRASTAVIECMAVEPQLQKLNQEVLIQSDIGVITNVRPDHLDEMGGPDRTVQGVARSLCLGMPVGGICVTSEPGADADGLWDILAEEAAKRNTELYYADPDSVTDAEMSHFTWITFKENVAIALLVAELRGVARQDALKAMYEAQPDPGVLRVDACEYAGVRFNAVNLFAANDPQSTVQNLELLRDRALIPAGVSIVINCRPDRVERNGQMGEIAEKMGAENIFLMGSPVKSAADQVAPHLRDRIIALEGEQFSGEDLLQAITAQISGHPEHAVVLIGNIHGRGEELLDAIEHAGYAGPNADAELAAILDEVTQPLPVIRRTRLDQTRLDLRAVDETLTFPFDDVDRDPGAKTIRLFPRNH